MLNGGGRPGGIEPSGIHCCCWFIAPQVLRCAAKGRVVPHCGMTQSRKLTSCEKNSLSKFSFRTEDTGRHTEANSLEVRREPGLR